MYRTAISVLVRLGTLLLNTMFTTRLHVPWRLVGRPALRRALRFNVWHDRFMAPWNTYRAKGDMVDMSFFWRQRSFVATEVPDRSQAPTRESSACHSPRRRLYPAGDALTTVSQLRNLALCSLFCSKCVSQIDESSSDLVYTLENYAELRLKKVRLRTLDAYLSRHSVGLESARWAVVYRSAASPCSAWRLALQPAQWIYHPVPTCPCIGPISDVSRVAKAPWGPVRAGFHAGKESWGRYKLEMMYQ